MKSLFYSLALGLLPLVIFTFVIIVTRDTTKNGPPEPMPQSSTTVVTTFYGCLESKDILCVMLNIDQKFWAEAWDLYSSAQTAADAGLNITLEKVNKVSCLEVLNRGACEYRVIYTYKNEERTVRLEDVLLLWKVNNSWLIAERATNFIGTFDTNGNQINESLE